MKALRLRQLLFGQSYSGQDFLNQVFDKTYARPNLGILEERGQGLEPVDINGLPDDPGSMFVALEVPSWLVVFDVDDESKIPQPELTWIKTASVVVKTPRGAHYYFKRHPQTDVVHNEDSIFGIDQLRQAPTTHLSMFTDSHRVGDKDYTDEEGKGIKHVRSLDIVQYFWTFIPPTKGYKVVKLGPLTDTTDAPDSLKRYL